VGYRPRPTITPVARVKLNSPEKNPNGKPENVSLYVKMKSFRFFGFLDKQLAAA